MLIDKILSQYRIKTKVLIFVLPFVMTISTVGLTGLYASGMLQGRMEISNNILQSLSGFKDLYGSMDSFLQNTNEEARDKLYSDIEIQKETLDAALIQIGERNGRKNLEAASQGTAQISETVGRLWTLHERELEQRRSIEAARDAIVAGRLDIEENTQQLAESIRNQQSKATSTLRAADRVSKGGDTLANVTIAFNTVQSSDDKLKAVSDAIPKLLKVQRLIELSVSQSQKELVKSIQTIIEDLKAQANAPDAATERGIESFGQHLSRFREISTDTQLAAMQMMRQATTIFVELDARMAQTNAVLENTRHLTAAISSLQLALSDFTGKANKQSYELLHQQIAEVRTNLDALAASANGMDLAEGITAAISPSLTSMDAASAELAATVDQRIRDYEVARQELDIVWKQLTTFAELQKVSAGTERMQANSISILTTGFGIFVSIIGGVALVLTLQRPIGHITAAMRRIADGALDTRISGEQRFDEIGDMARALGIFKENAIAKIHIEEQSEKERSAAECERRRSDSEKLEVDRQIEFAVNSLAAGLHRLAQGDISVIIDTPFIGRLEQLRQDFNNSMIRLQATMRHIRDNVANIHGNGNQMARSAENLSRRTEQQAASLEETAAAVDQITTTVLSSAERAKDTNQIVREAKRSADDSAAVVNDAIAAMMRIEDASHEIEQITSVIDEIAFQTNLLALNAGIEAARAGEAGKGFAVVAMEVRELAQRSAAAAQEIKGLITKSTNEVNSGSRLVEETGTVLAMISSQIVTISQHVETIAGASQDQASALQEVNSAVNQMDQMTQQNAAMVEETTAASRKLATEADALLNLVQQFRIEGEASDSTFQRAA